jgi:hypothetical protein
MFDIVLVDLLLRQVLPVDSRVSWEEAEEFLQSWNASPRDCVAVAIPSDLVDLFNRFVNPTQQEGITAFLPS